MCFGVRFVSANPRMKTRRETVSQIDAAASPDARSVTRNAMLSNDVFWDAPDRRNMKQKTGPDILWGPGRKKHFHPKSF